MNNIKDFNTDDIEFYLFPELKQFHNLKSKLQLISNSNIKENISNFICVKKEVVRHNKVVEEPMYIDKEQTKSLVEVIGEIKIIREEKEKKKLLNQASLIKEKENKFNKIYDKSGLPVNLRKDAYNHFVLNKLSYTKDIKLNRIEKFVSEIDVFNTKKQKKIIRKNLENIVDNNILLTLTDYGVKHESSLFISKINYNLKRNVDVIFLDKDDISKYRKELLSDSNDSLLLLINEKLKESESKELERINKLIDNFSMKINLNTIERNIMLESISYSVNTYNREDAFEKFIYRVFELYSKKSKYFSTKQNQVFSIRNKFRNKVIIDIDSFSFNTCVYLKYKDLKISFLNLIKEREILNDSDFIFWFKNFNENLISTKIENSKKIILEHLNLKYQEIIKNNIEHEKIIKKTNLFLSLKDFLLYHLSREPENRRREISSERILEIFNGEKDSVDNLVKKSLIEKLVNIDYKESFSIARKYKRNFIFYVGKTNSGKTYKAFNQLTKYDSGCYLSPLRLLALEGKEEINDRGKKCNMLTGEEKFFEEDAKFTSSTIEMLDTTKEVDCVVIDEIQMIKDENRGWAWTQAVIGAPSKNVILTGSDEVLSLIEDLISYTGDHLVIERLERKSPLKILQDVSRLEKIKKGTAIIAFSRKEVLKYKTLLKDKKLSIIYGNLGPDVRKEEARRFRTGESDILIATDAIAMGLNLPIETVLFTTHSKSIKGAVVELDEQLVQQIAGRAGRYGIKNIGYVGALNLKTFKYIQEIMKRDIPEYIGNSTIMPNYKYLEQIQSVLKINNFKDTLIAFSKYAAFENDLFSCTDLDRMIELADEIEKYGLSVKESLSLCSAPVRDSSDDGLYYFNKYVSKVVENLYLPDSEKYITNSPTIDKFLLLEKTNDSFVLKKAEEYLHNIDLYNWFSQHYPDTFPDNDGVLNKKFILNNFIINSLQEIIIKKEKKKK